MNLKAGGSAEPTIYNFTKDKTTSQTEDAVSEAQAVVEEVQRAQGDDQVPVLTHTVHFCASFSGDICCMRAHMYIHVVLRLFRIFILQLHCSHISKSKILTLS